MLTKSLFLSLLALSGANAACLCYTTDPIVTGSKISVSNGYDNNDFSPCFPTGGCGFIAYSGSATVGWSNITLSFNSPADPTGKIMIYDGNTSDPNTLITTYSTSDTGAKTFSSSTPFIYVFYTQSDASKPDAYFGTLKAGSSFAAPVTIPPSTTARTTKYFNDTSYAHDPAFISHDCLIIINQRTNAGAAGLTALGDIATQFVNLLSVSTDYPGTESQTRLGLATLTPYNPFYAAQGEIWKMTAENVVSALPKAGVSIDVNIINALDTLVPVFFNVSSPTAPTRKNVQRSVLLLTAWWDDTQDLTLVKKTFDDYGVNLAVVGYNTTSTTLKENEWYNYVSLTTTTSLDVASIVNRYFFNSAWGGNALTNNWCKKIGDPVTDGNFSEPNPYGGPTNTTWESTDGQKMRYCNYQDTTYTYQRTSTNNTVAFTVYYELEVEQDFLKFYADGVEVESFTGMDVNNAYFELDANVTTARFTTDNAGVRRGFYVKIEEKSKSS